MLLLVGCATPSDRVDRLAAELRLTKGRVPSTPVPLVAYRNASEVTGGRLHVYLEGDGTPWLTRTRISPDPTPRDPLALRLMALDPAPSLYLARPCYNGTATQAGCGPWYWTMGRYSEPVVASMASVLRGLIDAEGVAELVIIGHSGGGVLAWLLAHRIRETRALVTIAANLDIDAWADLHGFSRLTDSLNPAAGPPLPAGIAQWHLVGERDREVPASIIDGLRDLLGPDARVLVMASDHRCCWLGLWSDVLPQLP
ncbi:MAG: alpha/beta hydrolase [Chromatiaceae bacterium]|nr:alpha/beta hydrolase [Chromatiaceae bacterium]